MNTQIWMPLWVVVLTVCSACVASSGTESRKQSSSEKLEPSSSTRDSEAPAKKRAAPVPRQAVSHAGVRYREVRDGKNRGLSQNSGQLEAIDNAGTVLWVVKIYDVQYGDIEDDKSEIYFTSMKLDRTKRQLTVINERGERYSVSLADGHAVRTR